MEDEYSLASETDTYAMIGSTSATKKALYDYSPQRPDEMQIKAGDQIIVKQNLGNGWLSGKNKRTGSEGLVPANYVTD